MDMAIELTGKAAARRVPGGRVRVARTRKTIVAAALALAKEGRVAPIVKDVARQADVSARTVFQHFADTTELYLEVLDGLLADLFATTSDQDRPDTADRRIARTVTQRAARFEAARQAATFVEMMRQRSPEAAVKIRDAYAADRAQLAAWFDRDLSALAADRRARALTALASSLSLDGWMALRERFGLSPERAEEEWRFVGEAILSAGAAR